MILILTHCSTATYKTVTIVDQKVFCRCCDCVTIAVSHVSVLCQSCVSRDGHVTVMC